MDSFRISLSVPPDRERLVAELFLGGEQMAELSHEDPNASMLLELYARRDGEPWRVPIDEFVRALESARARLAEH